MDDDRPIDWKEYLERSKYIRMKPVLSATDRRFRHGREGGAEQKINALGVWEGQISEPIPVYLISCSLLAERGIEGATVRSWRCVLFENDKEDLVEALDLIKDKDERARLLRIVDESALPRLAEVLKVVAGLDMKRKQEVRILEVPGLFFTAMWLAGQDPNRDVFVPFVSRWGLEALRDYERVRFEELLKRIASIEVAREGDRGMEKSEA